MSSPLIVMVDLHMYKQNNHNHILLSVGNTQIQHNDTCDYMLNNKL